MMKEKEKEKAKEPPKGPKNKRTGFYAALYSCVGLMLAMAVIIGFNRFGGPQAADSDRDVRGVPATAQPTPPAGSGRATQAPESTPQGAQQDGQTPIRTEPGDTTQPEATAQPGASTGETPQATQPPTQGANGQTGEIWPVDGNFLDLCDCCDEVAPVFAPETPGGITEANIPEVNAPAANADQTNVIADFTCFGCCDAFAYEMQRTEYGFDPFAQYHRMSWPVSGEIIMEYNSSGMVFNPTLDAWRTNYNVAIAAPVNTEVQAAAAGRVREVIHTREMGTKVVIDHGNGWVTTYGQLQSGVRVATGTVVSRGYVLGFVNEPTIGSSGLEPHVAFQVFRDDATVNPVSVLMER